MSTIDFLFSGISPDSRRRLDAERRLEHFEPHDDILRWDECPQRLHQILRGRAKVWRPDADGRATVMFFLHEGDAAGLMAVCRDVAGSATISAVEPMTTHSWPARLIQDLLHHDGQLAENALALVARRAEILADRVGDLTSVRADQQLARALLRLVGEEGSWSDNHEATVPVTRQDLADMTRSTLHTASRTLSGWEAQHLVRSQRGKVTITDPAKLAHIAGLDVDVMHHVGSPKPRRPAE